MTTTYRTDHLVSAAPSQPAYFGAPQRREGETWVYYHLAADGLVLYIGKTRIPVERMRAHQTGSAWYPEIDRVVWFGPMDEVNAAAVERELITVEQPPCNIRHTDRDPLLLKSPVNRLGNAERRAERLTADLRAAKRRLRQIRDEATA